MAEFMAINDENERITREVFCEENIKSHSDFNTSLADGSPMPTSPSSMVNQYRLEEEQQDANTRDLFVSVDNPESHTTRSEFDSSEFEVRRRYQDFLWLRSRLEENHPTLIVHELMSHKKQGPGFLSRMGETVRAVANSVRGLRSRPEEFTLMQEYVEDFSTKICSVDKYLDELKQYSPTYSQWAESEEELAEPLRAVASCVERCGLETEEQIQHLSEVLVPALHERRDNIQAEFEAKKEALESRRVDQEARGDVAQHRAQREAPTLSFSSYLIS
ncbi:hypothetical protein FQN60_007079 [Etheostoma spectabile]|uniref:PX domain-containing protein n=1 Tax=Etheostoma spectabile TaxID=54343 RepID=A0A5J5CFX7_9PERO|nr:hypothetical protein FQN60_007079 [Etheostoma spectabile]